MDADAKRLLSESALASLAECAKKIEDNNKERMNTFLWLMDETVERERPETITFRRPILFEASN
jgi:translation elongation factor EF-1alpha